MELTTKECNKDFSGWGERRQVAFDEIKKAVVSRECLTTINFDLMPEYKIFITMNVSDYQSGAVLSFGKSWETAWPVVFDSMTFKGVELNYLVHEKEMLAIICALQKWRSDFVGVPFFVYMDHKTLKNFDTQCDLSRWQACWMEFMSQYDCKIVYIKEDENLAADALFQMSFDAECLANNAYCLSSKDLVAAIYNCKDSSFSCAQLLADPVTLESGGDSFVVASTLSIVADEGLLESI
jgi:hypothetical protein